MAESYAPADWKSALTGRQFERSGMQAYGAAKLFNIMLAKEYSKRLKVYCHSSTAAHGCIHHKHVLQVLAFVVTVQL
jgi:hypothetical protein